MSASPARRATLIVALILLAVLILLLVRCNRPVLKEAPPPAATALTTIPVTPEPSHPIVQPEPAIPSPEEILTPATVDAPVEVKAGALFSVTWTGPNNAKDYVTVVPPEAQESAYASYRETREGNVLELTAPIESGAFEVRYIAGTSKKILGRAPINVLPAGATLDAPEEIILGANFSVNWTGPDNKDDYITIVSQDTPDGKYANFTYTNKGSPLILTALTLEGAAELRYMTGKGAKVLARRAVKIVLPEVTLNAPSQSIAGAVVEVTWKGPNNAGDYITIVTPETRDGLYGNYTNTNAGSPLKITAPILSGPAELRYMTGQGAKVLARRPLDIVAAAISIQVPREAVVGATVTVTWTGPNNGGDYLTIVPKTARDGHYGSYSNTTAGPSLTITAPKEPGEAEVRYMSGQGAKVLARQAILIVSSP